MKTASKVLGIIGTIRQIIKLVLTSLFVVLAFFVVLAPVILTILGFSIKLDGAEVSIYESLINYVSGGINKWESSQSTAIGFMVATVITSALTPLFGFIAALEYTKRLAFAGLSLDFVYKMMKAKDHEDAKWAAPIALVPGIYMFFREHDRIGGLLAFLAGIFAANARTKEEKEALKAKKAEKAKAKEEAKAKKAEEKAKAAEEKAKAKEAKGKKTEAKKEEKPVEAKNEEKPAPAPVKEEKKAEPKKAPAKKAPAKK